MKEAKALVSFFSQDIRCANRDHKFCYSDIRYGVNTGNGDPFERRKKSIKGEKESVERDLKGTFKT